MAELNGAQDSASTADKARANAAKQAAELQSRLEEAEAQGGKGLKNQIRKLESRIMELENDLDTEARKSADVIKTARKTEKKVKEMQFAVDDEKKTAERAQDTADKLNQKLKKMRVQLEEAVSLFFTLVNNNKGSWVMLCPKLYYWLTLKAKFIISSNL